MDKKPENSLVESLGTNLGGVGTDLLEIGIDSVLEDGVLQDIPIINSIIGIYKTGASIREYLFMKKLIKFLNEFKKINEIDRQRFISEELGDKEKREKFGETILSLIEKADESKKLNLYAQVFKLHIMGKCTYDESIRICTMIDKIFYSDLEYLIKFQDGSFEERLITEELYKNGFLSYSGIDGGSASSNGGIIYNKNRYGNITEDALQCV